MPIEKGTLPKPKNWVQCDLHDFKAAVQTLRNNYPLTTADEGNIQTYKHAHTQQVLARIITHKRSQQCMVAFSMRDHLPFRHKDMPKSIYEGGSL